MLQTRLEDEIRAVAGKVPGVALVVVDAEGVRARAATGLADVAMCSPMTTEVAAPWFSMTKIATATLAVCLAERGVIDLDVPVASLVPEMSVLRPQEWADSITPRHLLQHTAGLVNPLPVRWVHPAADRGPDPSAFLKRILGGHRKLREAPGGLSRYSNLGAPILAAAMSRATGQSFEVLMRHHILDPLGMTSTGFGTVEHVRRATGYHPRGNRLRWVLPSWSRGRPAGPWLALEPFAVDGPAYGGLVGTAEDAALFLRMHLAGGVLGAARIVSPEGAEEMTRIDAPGKTYDLGLGWFRPVKQRAVRPAFVEHLGGGAGFWNVMRVYPTAGVGAVVMGNATRYDADAVAALALEAA